MDSDNLEYFHQEDRPTPDNFNEFLPWACQKLGIHDNIILTYVLTKFETPFSTGRLQKHGIQKVSQHISKNVEGSKEKISDSRILKNVDVYVNNVNITTIYDSSENLLQLKFEKNNKKIPRKIFKILALILPYHNHLTNISINSGINMAISHELHKLTKLNITDICLDGTCVSGGNYDLLLEERSNLKNLSIARCNIGDDTVKLIADKITSSKTLALLNLASNRITDNGANYLAEALRYNRCLVYLNLSDNTITDIGVIAILKVLDKFKVLPHEMLTSRNKYIQLWKENNPPNDKNDESKKVLFRRSTKAFDTRGEKRNKSNKHEMESKKHFTYYENDAFVDPFSRRNTFLIDDEIYCYGNNQLAYLNISYNYISYFTVAKILTVLKYQKSLNRSPIGLVHLAIEGNYIPSNCDEYNEIIEIIGHSFHKKHSSNKMKKKHSNFQ